MKTKDSFIQNFAFVFGSKSISFLIGFALTPIIARLFLPQAYGSYALYHAIVLNISLFLTLKIPTVFVILKSEGEFKNLLHHLMGLITMGVLILSIIITFFGDVFFNESLNKSFLGHWYIIPLGVYLYALAEILANWNVREKKFREISKLAPIEAFATKLSALGIGWFHPFSILGLIHGEIIGKMLYLFLYIKKFLKGRIHWLIPRFSIPEWKKLIINYKEYPLYILPAHWVSIFTNSIIIFFLSSEYTSEEVGLYSMAIGLISIPMNVIAYSLQPILTQKIASLADIKKSTLLIEKFVQGSLIISMFILPIGFFFSEIVINLFLGPGWERSAVFVSWMLPLVGFQITFFPLIGALIGFEKNKSSLGANVIRFLIVFVGIIIVQSLFSNLDLSIVWLIVTLLASYFLAIIYILIEIRMSLQSFMAILAYLIGTIIYLYALVFINQT